MWGFDYNLTNYTFRKNALFGGMYIYIYIYYCQRGEIQLFVFNSMFCFEIMARCTRTHGSFPIGFISNWARF